MMKLKNKFSMFVLFLISTCVAANIGNYDYKQSNNEYLEKQELDNFYIPDYERIAIIQWINKVKSPKVKLDIDSLIDSVFKQANINKIDPYLIFGLIKKESTFNSNAISSANAIGLTQVIAKWHPKEVSKRNLKDPLVSVEVGSAVVKKYIDAANGNLRKALKLYSGGATNYYEKVTNNANNLKSHIKTYELAYQKVNYRIAYFDTTKVDIDFSYISPQQKLQKFDLDFFTYLSNTKIDREKRLDQLIEQITNRS